jgi:hypothetical protein
VPEQIQTSLKSRHEACSRGSIQQCDFHARIGRVEHQSLGISSLKPRCSPVKIRNASPVSKPRGFALESLAPFKKTTEPSAGLFQRCAAEVGTDDIDPRTTHFRVGRIAVYVIKVKVCVDG